jgi:hypothetical protein
MERRLYRFHTWQGCNFASLVAGEIIWRGEAAAVRMTDRGSPAKTVGFATVDFALALLSTGG